MDKKLKLSAISVLMLTVALFGLFASICLNIANLQMANAADVSVPESEMLVIPPSPIPEIQEEELLDKVVEEGVETKSETTETTQPEETVSGVAEETQPIEDSKEEPNNVETKEEVQETVPETKEETVETTQPKEEEKPAKPETKPEPEVEQEVVDTSNKSYREISVVATAYCSCQKCCGKYALNRPKDENGNPIVYAATGAICKPNHTIAVDPNYIPYGTVVEYNGIKWVAEDCGGGVKGYHIDIYYDDHQEALNWGRRTITVKVYY